MAAMKRTMSLKGKLIALFITLLVVAMSALMVGTYAITRNSQTKQYVNYNRNILELSAGNITNSFKQMLTVTLVPYSNPELYNTLTDRNIDASKSNDNIRKALLSILTSNKDISQAHLDSKVMGYNYVAKNSVFQFQSEDQYLANHSENTVTVTYNEQKDYGLPLTTAEKDVNVFTIRRELFSIPGNVYIGAFDIDVKQSFFLEPNIDLITDDSEMIAFKCGNETIFTYPHNESQRIMDIIESCEFSGDSDVLTVRTDQKYTVLYKEIMPGLGMKNSYLIKIMPESEIERIARDYAVVIFTFGIVLLLIAVVLIARMASHFTEPFGYIEKQLKKISQGNLDVQLDIKDSEEFSVFAEQFNIMVSSLNSIITNEYRLNLENKSNQLKALQAQLNPHFINNTLQSIGAEALKKGNMKLYTSIIQFGEMMRYTMSFKDLDVQFWDELEYTENYIKLQKMRFEDRFTYTIRSTEEANLVIVPKLLLQPLVENTFKYGFSSETVQMSIVINARIENRSFVLECSNTGKEVSEQELARLSQSIEEARRSSAEQDHIGLRNLARRLQLLYGDAAVLAIRTDKNKGFSVTVSFPLEGRK